MKAGRRLRRRERGFTYLGALFLVMLLGLGLAGSFQLWSLSNQRAREQELLWIGTQYARALKSYYLHSPGQRQYPLRLEDLLEDKRFPAPRRHLRRLYPDPITRSGEWGLIKTADGRITGIHSLSEQQPWKRADFPLRWAEFVDKQRYADWRFVADVGLLGEVPPAAGVAPPAAAAGAAPAPLLRP